MATENMKEMCSKRTEKHHVLYASLYINKMQYNSEFLDNGS